MAKPTLFIFSGLPATGKTTLAKRLAEDLNAVGINWQGDSNNWSDGNFDASPGVAAGDLNILAINWQQSSTAGAAAVPEPSLLGGGIAWLLAFGGLLFRRC